MGSNGSVLGNIPGFDFLLTALHTSMYKPPLGGGQTVALSGTSDGNTRPVGLKRALSFVCGARMLRLRSIMVGHRPYELLQ